MNVFQKPSCRESNPHYADIRPYIIDSSDGNFANFLGEHPQTPLNTLQNDASDSSLTVDLTGDSADIDINQLTGTCPTNASGCVSPTSIITLDVTSDNAIIQINQKDSANDS